MCCCAVGEYKIIHLSRLPLLTVQALINNFSNLVILFSKLVIVNPLFQITNQMITACKSYISCQKTETVWTQDQADVVRKLNDCIKLNEEYQRCFHKTKEKLEKMPNERPFEFSEMYIFGKFDTFTRRLKKIIEMFETISMYSHLSESKIEGGKF